MGLGSDGVVLGGRCIELCSALGVLALTMDIGCGDFRSLAKVKQWSSNAWVLRVLCAVVDVCGERSGVWIIYWRTWGLLLSTNVFVHLIWMDTYLFQSWWITTVDIGE